MYNQEPIALLRLLRAGHENWLRGVPCRAKVLFIIDMRKVVSAKGRVLIVVLKIKGRGRSMWAKTCDEARGMDICPGRAFPAFGIAISPALSHVSHFVAHVSASSSAHRFPPPSSTIRIKVRVGNAPC